MGGLLDFAGVVEEEGLESCFLFCERHDLFIREVILFHAK